MKQVLTQDGRDLLVELSEAGVRFLVVGGHALAVYGVSRATVDLDIFVQPDRENAARVMHALAAFGAPTGAHGVTTANFEQAGTIYQLGLPPNRIDLMTAIDGVSFEDAWAGRVDVVLDGITVSFLGRDDLLTNKRSAGRTKDIADVLALEEVGVAVPPNPHESGELKRRPKFDGYESF